jgi:hypothetical protein
MPAGILNRVAPPKFSVPVRDWGLFLFKKREEIRYGR